MFTDGTGRTGAATAGKVSRWLLTARGKRYLYTETQWMALVVLHLRNHHADLDPDLH